MAMSVNLAGLKGLNAYARERITPNNTTVTPTANTVNNVTTGTAVMTLVSGGSQGLPPAKRKAQAALFTATGTVYLTFEGTTPSASVGIPMSAGDTILIEGYQHILNLKVFAATSVPCELVYFTT